VPDGAPAKAKPGSYGPVPILTSRFLTLTTSGGLEGVLTTSNAFYGSNETKPLLLLLLTDGTYLKGQARADHLGGDQWGMMNETGNYPGQPWMWLYTFWYQVKPFSASGNAGALVGGLMAALTLVLIFVPYNPRSARATAAPRRPPPHLARHSREAISEIAHLGARRQPPPDGPQRPLGPPRLSRG